MHVSTNLVKTIWLKVYGYDYGMICFDTRFWYFTQDDKKYVYVYVYCIPYIKGKSLK